MKDPFVECREYAFRVEGLPHYDVPGTDEKLEYFEKTGRADPALNADWVKTVSDCVARGSRVMRLRLVSDELSRYERFEVEAGYQLAIDVGEEVRTVKRSDYPAVADFWSFDTTWIRRMSYDAGGKFLTSEVGPMTEEEKATESYWLRVFAGADALA